MREVRAKLHRDLAPTRLWTCGGSWPGPTFETRSGQELLIEWANDLPARHFLPIDHRLHGAEAGQPDVRTVVHVHGAKVRPDSDGFPEDWYTQGKSVTYHYPNNQDAAMLWYHDHAMGINRLNIYAGLMGAFIVRDAVEDALNLPKGRYEIPLVICDRLLRQDGQLDYPDSGAADAPWVPEVFGDVMLVNGKAFPYLEVEPRKYRFRVLNASNGRFYTLGLSNGKEFQQIGTDQGLLPGPVPVKTLILAPGERVDLVIDFREYAGQQIVLNNDAFVARCNFASEARRWPIPAHFQQSFAAIRRTAETEAVKTRPLTLDEY